MDTHLHTLTLGHQASKHAAAKTETNHTHTHTHTQSQLPFLCKSTITFTPSHIHLAGLSVKVWTGVGLEQGGLEEAAFIFR